MAKKGAIPYVPNQDEKVIALADVAYEIEQMLELGRTGQPEGDLQRNAWLESILIHTRQLLDFFERSKRSIAKGRENDDVLAVDFGFRAEPVDLDELFRERLNKDLAHLSYSRQKRMGPDKQWDLTKLRPLLQRSHEFAKHVTRDSGRLLEADGARRWVELAQALYDAEIARSLPQ